MDLIVGIEEHPGRDRRERQDHNEDAGICSTDPVYRGARSRGRLGAWQTQQRGSAGWRSGGRAG